MNKNKNDSWLHQYCGASKHSKCGECDNEGCNDINTLSFDLLFYNIETDNMHQTYVIHIWLSM